MTKVEVPVKRHEDALVFLHKIRERVSSPSEAKTQKQMYKTRAWTNSIWKWNGSCNVLQLEDNIVICFLVDFLGLSVHLRLGIPSGFRQVSERLKRALCACKNHRSRVHRYPCGPFSTWLGDICNSTFMTFAHTFCSSPKTRPEICCNLQHFVALINRKTPFKTDPTAGKNDGGSQGTTAPLYITTWVASRRKAKSPTSRGQTFAFRSIKFVPFNQLFFAHWIIWIYIRSLAWLSGWWPCRIDWWRSSGTRRDPSTTGAREWLGFRLSACDESPAADQSGSSLRCQPRSEYDAWIEEG